MEESDFETVNEVFLWHNYNFWLAQKKKPLIVNFSEKSIVFNNTDCRLILLNNLTLEFQLENSEARQKSQANMTAAIG